MKVKKLDSSLNNIKFGTDGWRGVIGVDFTLDNLVKAVFATCEEFKFRHMQFAKSKKIIIGYDRRFMAEEFACSVIDIVSGSGLQPYLAKTAVTTPSCSLSVLKEKALGAIIITASHNPYNWLGLKIKDFQGCSVDRDFTESVERRIFLNNQIYIKSESSKLIDIRLGHIEHLKKKFNINHILTTIKNIYSEIIIDSMYGSASGYMTDLCAEYNASLVKEIRLERDTLFGGYSPEPIEPNVKEIINKVKEKCFKNISSIGIIFDGDGDRIAVIDETGRYCSTQVLMPLLIHNLVKLGVNKGIVLKTVSGSDLMSLIAKRNNLDVFETPVGFKYIASKMLNEKVLIGGEESGGIGFGEHIPERDAIYTAILLLDIISKREKPLSFLLEEINKEYGESFYERIDFDFQRLDKRDQFEEYLKNSLPDIIQMKGVQNVTNLDGIKLRIDHLHWILFRFSGTEPLLRLYCEAKTIEDLNENLHWAKNLINNFLENH
tara:strand:+ start:7661 stop:9133 length:1473 start_codon:yes stop_codon:yes gene_type:complete